MPPVIDRVRLEGLLTRQALEQAVQGVTTKGGLALIDCRAMTDYELAARHAFVEWLKRSKPAKVAIVTDRELWHLVIRTMSLASGVPLMPFADERAARDWLLA